MSDLQLSTLDDDLDITGEQLSIVNGDEGGSSAVPYSAALMHFAEAVAGTGCRVLDTRKTIPGLRTAQKYASACGGAPLSHCSLRRLPAGGGR